MAELLLESGDDEQRHYRRLCALIEQSVGPVRVATAYLTNQRLLRLTSAERRLIVPIQPMDVLSGAISLSCIRALIEDGVECRAIPNQPRFHAKVYIFGDSHAAITSANLTGSGLHSNVEAGVVVDGDDVLPVIEWFDRMWSASTTVTVDDLVDVKEATDALRHDFESFRRRAQLAVPEVALPLAGRRISSSIAGLFESAERFFICNTNRKRAGRTALGGAVTEEAMRSHGFAAAWEPFNYETHMQDVRVGDAILMFAKGVGIIAVGTATGPCETLPVGDPNRIFNGDAGREWRVPATWLQWVDDAAALKYHSGNYTFANVSGDNYEQLRRDTLRHFTSLEVG